MELRTLHLDGQTLRTRVYATHPDRVVDVELSSDATARLLTAAAPFLNWLATAGYLPQGASLEALWLDADQKTVTVQVAGECHRVDYLATQNLLRELARSARREAVARKPDPPGLSPSLRWEYLYHHGGDGWEMGKATPPLARYFRAHPPAAATRSLVVGCGRGHEAILLAEVGDPSARVIGIDLAPAAVAIASRLAAQKGVSDRVSFAQQDLFAWPSREPSECGSFDLVVEHNCFCAIEPQHRDDYVAAVAQLLRPGGRLVGLFYPHDYPGGPPYASTADEIQRRLQAAFSITYQETPTDSAITRAGLELLLVAERRASG